MKKRCCLVTKLVQHFCNHLDFSSPCSSVHGISQERTLEWVAISFSRDHPHPGLKPTSPAWQAASLLLSHQGRPRKRGVQSSHSVVSDSLLPQGLQQPGFPVHHQSLLKLLSIKSVMPSNYLICHPLLLLPSIFPTIRVFSNESFLYITWPKY